MNYDELWEYWHQLSDEWKEIVLDNGFIIPLKATYAKNYEYSKDKIINIFQNIHHRKALTINKPITDIDCLPIFSDLTTLIFDNKLIKIKDLSPLLKLPNLTYLSIVNVENNHPDIISQLTKLTHLTIDNDGKNFIQALDFLKYLPNLNVLKLTLTKQTNLDGLKYLKNLTELSLSNVNLLDLNINMILNEKMIGLSLNNCHFDLSSLPFDKLKNLRYLSLENNRLCDISPLGQLKNLSSLSLENNNIVDISALSHLTNLSELALSNNKICNIHSLSNLTKLKSLYLKDNQIQDITALYLLNKLSILEIVCDSNNIDEKSLLTLSEKLPYCTFWL